MTDELTAFGFDGTATLVDEGDADQATWELNREGFVDEVLFTKIDGTQQIELNNIVARNLNSFIAQVETLTLACTR